MIDINSSIKALKSIRQGSSEHGKAPHKLILILTIIELIEKKYVSENKFSIDSVFVGHFKENWNLLVNTLHIPDFTQPFFYLQSETIEGKPLWELHPNDNFKITNHIKSVNKLKEVVAYASFEKNFYDLLQEQSFRDIATTTILDKYFLGTKQYFILSKLNGQGYIHDLTSYMLNEREIPAYNLNLKTIDEEEIFVRSGYFPKMVRQVYSSTCCMSGMRLFTDLGSDLIEAAHIVPFSISKDDRVINGLALCPNLHTAFDRGLLGIDDNFKIMVSSRITENLDNPYSLSKLENKNILLPFGQKSYPAIENLRWHRKNVFKS